MGCGLLSRPTSVVSCRGRVVVVSSLFYQLNIFGFCYYAYVSGCRVRVLFVYLNSENNTVLKVLYDMSADVCTYFQLIHKQFVCSADLKLINLPVSQTKLNM